MKRSLATICKKRFGRYTDEGSKGTGGASSAAASYIPVSSYESEISVVTGEEAQAAEEKKNSAAYVAHSDEFKADSEAHAYQTVLTGGAESAIDASMTDNGTTSNATAPGSTSEPSFTVGEKNDAETRKKILTQDAHKEVKETSYKKVSWDVAETTNAKNGQKSWEVKNNPEFAKKVGVSQRNGYDEYFPLGKDKNASDEVITDDIYWSAMEKYGIDFSDTTEWPESKQVLFMKWLEGSGTKPNSRYKQMTMMSQCASGKSPGVKFTTSNPPEAAQGAAMKAFQDNLPGGSAKITKEEATEFKGKGDRAVVMKYFNDYVLKYGPNSEQVWNLIYNAQFSDMQTIYDFLREDLGIKDNKEMLTAKEDVEANLSTMDDGKGGETNKYWGAAAETKDRAIEQVGKAMEEEADDFVTGMVDEIKVGKEMETADKDYQTEMAKPKEMAAEDTATIEAQNKIITEVSPKPVDLDPQITAKKAEVDATNATIAELSKKKNPTTAEKKKLAAAKETLSTQEAELKKLNDDRAASQAKIDTANGKIKNINDKYYSETKATELQGKATSTYEDYKAGLPENTKPKSKEELVAKYQQYDSVERAKESAQKVEVAQEAVTDFDAAVTAFNQASGKGLDGALHTTGAAIDTAASAATFWDKTDDKSLEQGKKEAQARFDGVKEHYTKDNFDAAFVESDTGKACFNDDGSFKFEDPKAIKAARQYFTGAMDTAKSEAATYAGNAKALEETGHYQADLTKAAELAENTDQYYRDVADATARLDEKQLNKLLNPKDEDGELKYGLSEFDANLSPEGQNLWDTKYSHLNEINRTATNVNNVAGQLATGIDNVGKGGKGIKDFVELFKKEKDKDAKDPMEGLKERTKGISERMDKIMGTIGDRLKGIMDKIAEGFAKIDPGKHLADLKSGTAKSTAEIRAAKIKAQYAKRTEKATVEKAEVANEQGINENDLAEVKADEELIKKNKRYKQFV